MGKLLLSQNPAPQGQVIMAQASQWRQISVWCSNRNSGEWEESQHWAGSTRVQGCPKVIFAKWPTLWPINNLQWAWNMENTNFYGFTLPIQTIPRDVTFQKNPDGKCSYKGDMSNIKVADCSKCVLHRRHLTSAEKEWRGDHMGGAILVRGSFVSAESSLLKGAKRDEEEGRRERG